MKTKGGGTAFVLAREARTLGIKDTSEATPGEFMPIAPRWLQSFRPWPWSGRNGSRFDTDAPLTEVTYRGRDIRLFIPYRDFRDALEAAGVVLVGPEAGNHATTAVGP